MMEEELIQILDPKRELDEIGLEVKIDLFRRYPKLTKEEKVKLD